MFKSFLAAKKDEKGRPSNKSHALIARSHKSTPRYVVRSGITLLFSLEFLAKRFDQSYPTRERRAFDGISTHI